MDTIIRDGPILPDQYHGKPRLGSRIRNILYRIKSDHFHIKAYYFCFYGALGSLVPYLSVYFKQLGLEPDQIGLLHGFKPVIGFCGALILGNIADSFRIRRYLFLSSILCWIAFYVIIALVPPAARATECPSVTNTVIPPSKPAEISVLDRRDVFPAEDPLDNRILPGALQLEDRGPISVFTLNNTGSSDDVIKRPDEATLRHLQEIRSWMYDKDELHKLFVSILVFVVLGEIFHCPTSALADAGTLEQIGKDRVNEYGRHRAWGSVGLGLW